jgi:hypothetical protein
VSVAYLFCACLGSSLGSHQPSGLPTCRKQVGANARCVAAVGSFSDQSRTPQGSSGALRRECAVCSACAAVHTISGRSPSHAGALRGILLSSSTVQPVSVLPCLGIGDYPLESLLSSPTVQPFSVLPCPVRAVLTNQGNYPGIERSGASRCHLGAITTA